MASPMPAWKRLGLKLKYVNELPSTTQNNSGEGDANGTSSNIAISALTERPAKRQRLDEPEQHVGPSNANRDQNATEPINRNAPDEKLENSGLIDATATGHKHRMRSKKSVTFANDAKNEDGDSRITIDFPTGSPGSTPKKTKLSEHEIPSANPPSTGGGVDSDTSIAKPRKEKSTKKPKTKLPKDKTRPALDYLQQHRNDRRAWKFNKNRDVWILSHALNPATVPPTHVLALAGYIRGLPENAGARSRLVKDCRAAIAESGLEGDHGEQDKKHFIRLLENMETGEDDVEAFFQTHSRSALLLWALDEDIDTGTMATKHTTATPVKKKSRTMAAVDVSSSSESDSERDSSESSSQADKDPAKQVDVSVKISNDTILSSTSSDGEDSDETTSSSGSD